MSCIYQIAPSHNEDRDSCGSLQGSSIVSIPDFLPSVSFKNKTRREAVDNACRCASVIIKPRRTRGPVTLIPTNDAHRTRRRRCHRRRSRTRCSSLSTSGWCFLSKNAFPRGGLTSRSWLLACFSQGRETMRGTQKQETERGEEGKGNLLYPRTNFSALFLEAFQRHRMISELRCEQIYKSNFNLGICERDRFQTKFLALITIEVLV